MKKSILHRSFKPAKCKTALKLAASRMKLMKNKTGAEVNVKKRELAQLLQSGQYRTARIRVEHMLTEEKMMTAYELLEIYCEFIASRLPIIESQKNCPIDLKEAVASIIYASPRCADLPELMDVRKHLTAKYGKEFVRAALELRPNCGVSRMLVEKLSAKAPDGPSKMKILSGIAEEHNIKWDPKSFDEKEPKPPADLLNGPNAIEKSTKMHVESPKIQTLNHIEKEPPSNCIPPGQHAEHDANSSLHQQNSGVSPRSQNFAQHVDAYNEMLHASHPEARASGTPTEGSEYRHSHSGVMGEPPNTGHNWKTEFKDATTAARAAAEAAECASMAAWAAAELSSRGQTTTQYSMDSQSSFIHTKRGEVPQDSAGRNMQDERASVLSLHRQTSSQYSMDSEFASTGIRRDEVTQNYVDKNSHEENPSEVCSSNNIHCDRGSRMQYMNSDEVEEDNLAGVGTRFRGINSKTIETSGSASLKYHPTIAKDDSMRNPFWMEDNYTSKNSFKPEKSEHVSNMQYTVKSGNIDTFIQQGIERQPSHVSHSSQSAYSSDDRDVLEPSNQKIRDYSGNKSFVDFDQDEYQERVVGKEAYDNKSVAFDDSASDNDNDFMYKMMGQIDHNALHPSVPFSPHGREPSTRISENKSFGSTSKHVNGSPKTPISGSQFSINQYLSPVSSNSLKSFSPVGPPALDGLPPLIFDDLDEPSSEEEGTLHNFKLSGSHSWRGSQTKGGKNVSKGTSLIEEEYAKSKRKLEFQSLSRRQESDFNNESEETFDTSPSSSSGPMISQRHSNKVNGNFFNNAVKDTQHIQDSASESSKELNLGTLRGGLKHKNYRLPMYFRNSAGDSTDKQSVENYMAESESPSCLAAVRTSNLSGATYQDPYIRKENLKGNRKTFSTNVVTESDSDNDNPGEKSFKQTSNIRRQSSILKADSKVKEKSISKARLTYSYIGSDSDESVDDLPKQSLATKDRLTPEFSRRTRASQTSEKNPSNATPEAALCPSAVESLHSPQSQFRSSNHVRKIGQPSSANQAAPSKPISKSQSSLNDGIFSPSEKEETASTISKTASGSSEDPNTSNSKEEKLSRINSTSTASHVHPKLPDFDSFVAHMMSLHKNRE